MIIKPTSASAAAPLSNDSDYGKRFIDNVRRVNFRDKAYVNGVYLVMLPPYKLDASGEPVSLKVYEVRTNFGIGEKKISYNTKANCPIGFFASKCKSLFPDFAKIETSQISGKSMPVYPPFGRTQKRVLYNMGIMDKLEAGCHLTDLPLRFGAEKIDKWQKTPLRSGAMKPPINDPEQSHPILIKLADKSQNGDPWYIEIGADTYKVPDELCDSDNLYNLDEVLYYYEDDYLISILQRSVPSDIFNTCMVDWFRINNPTQVAVPGLSTHDSSASNSFDGDDDIVYKEAATPTTPVVNPMLKQQIKTVAPLSMPPKLPQVPQMPNMQSNTPVLGAQEVKNLLNKK